MGDDSLFIHTTIFNDPIIKYQGVFFENPAFLPPFPVLKSPHSSKIQTIISFMTMCYSFICTLPAYLHTLRRDLLSMANFIKEFRRKIRIVRPYDRLDIRINSDALKKLNIF